MGRAMPIIVNPRGNSAPRVRISRRLPPFSYGLCGIPYALAVIRWLVENVGMNTTWWNVHIQPILEPLLWPVVPAFFAGVVVEDLLNSKSWVKEFWRNLTRKF